MIGQKLEKIFLWNNKPGHDKFYDMYENDDGETFTAYWGRSWTYGQSKTFSMSLWDVKLCDKLEKGYEEVNSSRGYYNRND